MFKNVGKSIKNLANVLFIINIILIVLGGLASIIFMLSEGEFDGGAVLIPFVAIPIAMGILIFLARLSVMFLYGFGELIDTNKEIAENTRSLIGRSSYGAPAPSMPATKVVVCPNCGSVVNASSGVAVCQTCGNQIVVQ